MLGQIKLEMEFREQMLRATSTDLDSLKCLSAMFEQRKKLAIMYLSEYDEDKKFHIAQSVQYINQQINKVVF